LKIRNLVIQRFGLRFAFPVRVLQPTRLGAHGYGSSQSDPAHPCGTRSVRIFDSAGYVSPPAEFWREISDWSDTDEESSLSYFSPRSDRLSDDSAAAQQSEERGFVWTERPALGEAIARHASLREREERKCKTIT